MTGCSFAGRLRDTSRIVAQKFRDFLIVTDGDDLDKQFSAVSRASSVIRAGATGNVVMTGRAE